MKQIIRLSSALGAILIAANLGCYGPLSYRTAKTAAPGDGEFTVTMSVTRFKTGAVEYTNDAGELKEQTEESLRLPNFVPDIAYHHAVAEGLEIGGRVSLGALMGELDAKYRFIGCKGCKLNVAAAPAVGYRTALLFGGYHLTGPLIATIDFTENVGLNLVGEVSWLNLTVSDELADLGLDDMGVKSLAYGGAVGLVFSFDQVYLMPALEMYTANAKFTTSDLAGELETDIGIMNFMLSFGVNTGDGW